MRRIFLAWLLLLLSVGTTWSATIPPSVPLLYAEPSDTIAGLVRRLQQLYGSAQSQLVIAVPIRYGAYTAIPSYISIEMSGAGSIDCDSAIPALSPSGSFHASIKKVFANCPAGSVVFPEGAGVDCVRPEWWGAIATNNPSTEEPADPTIYATNTAAINAAHLSLPAQGGHICYPAGDILIDGPLKIRQQSRYTGAGRQATTFQTDRTGECFSVFQAETPRACTGGTGSCESAVGAGTRGAGCVCYTNAECQSNVCAGGTVERRVTIEHLKILLRDDYCIGIDAAMIGQSVFDDLTIIAQTAGNNQGILFSDGNGAVSGYSNTVQNSEITQNGIGLNLLPLANDQRIVGNIINVNTVGLKIAQNVNSTHIENNSFESNATYGLQDGGLHTWAAFNRYEAAAVKIKLDSTASTPTILFPYTSGAGALIEDSGAALVTFFDIASTFANLDLGGTRPNGTIKYCSNCTVESPCASGGTGAIAKRLGGAWECN